MSELLKKQNYGVEVEFTGISRKMAADAVAEIIGTAASRPDRTCYQTRTIQDSQGRKWKVMRDSSIHPISCFCQHGNHLQSVFFVPLNASFSNTSDALLRHYPHFLSIFSSRSFISFSNAATKAFTDAGIPQL